MNGDDDNGDDNVVGKQYLFSADNLNLNHGDQRLRARKDYIFIRRFEHLIENPCSDEWCLVVMIYEDDGGGGDDEDGGREDGDEDSDGGGHIII